MDLKSSLKLKLKENLLSEEDDGEYQFVMKYSIMYD